MGLETATYISDLETTNPLGSDAKSTADDHLRLIKSCLKTTFPSVTGAVTMTHTELNTVTSRGLIAGQTWTGTHTFPATTYGVTATLGDSSLKYATTEFVANTAFSSALPAQLGNSGKLLTTNGTAASWTAMKTVGGVNIIGSGDVPIGFTLLAVITPTVAANIDFLSTFSATYDNYLIIGNGIIGSASQQLFLRYANAGSVDTGSVYQTGVDAADAGAATTSISITLQNILTTGAGCNFRLMLQNCNSTSQIKSTHIQASAQDAASAYGISNMHAVYTAANAISGARIFWSGGTNFKAQGSIKVYGYQNS